MHLHAYLRSSETIINLYDGAIPFASWLKNYFREQKKFGSRDRRMVGDLCFCYYRLGKAFEEYSLTEQLLIGQALCHDKSIFIDELKPEWSGVSSGTLKDKLAFLLRENNGVVFPFLDEVSNDIEKDAFNLSHLVQPDLFLRIRPGKKEIVLQKIQTLAVSFSVEGDCLRLPIATKIDDALEVDKEVVVQDKSSQRVLNLLQHQTSNTECQTFSAWDCCAASGGKSILLHDHFPQVQLTVSDVRESILHNLKTRFSRAGIASYQSFVADVSSPQFHLNEKFDLIICDAPCSGSGTWGRTPEQLRFFSKQKIEYYSLLQKSIAVNAGKCLKEGGQFLYITCSVFVKENEDVVEYILQQTKLRLVKQQYFEGYDEKADTLFAALFAL
ncbi:Fmu (Sun) domain-containing protein [Flavisolibacter ginsenosidimutans]|uniref:Fmu (Sun) domain-containing protein n=1 Tax=Flavisolibacter ginsenosidimutans TaxID=661481 RepID=A0A5B8UI48_9BACT|nr:Fmu (Sun) domain-containing protein [Flavisolibacter ginsenosidimutans]QEC55770.1 Fmu (Sun) domain-containing protein [Flavisolibacter ginsenosidimutans]